MRFKPLPYVPRGAGTEGGRRRRFVRREYETTPLGSAVRRRRLAQGTFRWGAAVPVAAIGVLAAETDAQQVAPLLYVMLAISAVGAAVVYAVMAYAVWKFRDPKTRGRRYG